jgi:basic membrane protein A
MKLTFAKAGLALAAVATLAAGCGSSSGSSGTTDNPDATKVAIITSGAPNDVGWNQAMVDQARKLEEDGEISLTVLQQAADVDSTTMLQGVTQLADAGNDVIIAHSFNYGEPMKTMVKNYPDVLFAYAGGFGDVEANLADYSQPYYQGSFLAGILAGGVTETGVLGGTAGFDIPVCHSMLEAFVAGAKLSYQGPGTIQFKTAYIGSWGDVAKTKEAVTAMEQQGADQFVTCGLDAGTIAGVKGTDAMGVGYTMDQSSLAPDNVLSSVQLNFGKVVEEMVADSEAGAVDPARYYDLGLADGYVSLVVNPNLEDRIPPETLAMERDYEAKMKSGAFEAPYVEK